MERASAVVDTIVRLLPGQYVVIEPGGRRPVTDYNAAAASEMPAVPPFVDNKA
jgi:hypothetical protein